MPTPIYPAQTWVNEESGGTPISAARLNNMEKGIGIATTLFNVKQYGAIGDGTHDDLTAINNAIAAAIANGGGIIFFPTGNYAVSAAIGSPSVTYYSIALIGDGSRSSIISALNNTFLFRGAWGNCEWSNLTLDGAGKGSGIFSVHIDKCIIDNVWMQGWNGKAMNLNDGTYGDLGLLNRITRCNIDQNNGYGIYATYRFIDSWIDSCNIGSSIANISLEGGPVRVFNNHLDGSPTRNLELRGNKRITIENNIMEGAQREAILYTMPTYLTTSDDCQIQIVGNAFSNGGKESAGVYAAIEIIGVSTTARTRGFNITGNLFACEDVGSGWDYCIEGSNVQWLSAIGSQWAKGHTATNPVRLTGSVNYEVIGNHGDNAVTTT